MKNPRVTIVDHNAVRGAGRTLYRLLAERYGCTLSLVVPSVWADPFGRATADPEETALRVVPLPVLFGGKTHRVLYRGLGAELRSFQPDILYVNSEPEGFLACQGVRLCRQRRDRTKLIFDSWRNIPYTPVSYPVKFSRVSAAVEKRVLRFAEHGIVHNQAAEEIFTAKGFASVTRIPPWVDTALFRPQEHAPADSRFPFTVGYVGRLIQEKGVDVLLQAAATLGSDVRSIIVGSGPAEGSLKALSHQLGLDDRVVWHRGVAQKDLPALYARLDVLVLPSRRRFGWIEQFGRVLIEAMACGVPVIGSHSGEIPNVIGEAGLTFPEDDFRALSTHLAMLRDYPALRKEYGVRGRARVVGLFEVQVVAAQYAALFRAL